MRQLSFLFLSALVAILFAAGQSSAAPAASAASAGAADYAIKLDVPAKVGDKADLVASGSKKQQAATTVAGAAPIVRSEAFDYQLEGLIETLAVDAKGRETKVSLTVAKATRTDAGQTVDIVPAGTVVRIESNGGGITITVTPSNVIVPIEAVAVFEAAGLVNTSGGAGNDEIFGTGSRQKVGASWDMNVAAGTKDISAALNAGVVGLGGKTTLNKAFKVDGVECLELTMTASLGVTSMAALPPSSKVEKSEFKMTSTIVVPADASAAPVTQSDTTKMTNALTVKGATPDGKEVTVQASGEDSSRKVYKPKAK